MGMKKIAFNDSERDTNLVKRITEYQKKQGLPSFFGAVRNLCEDALDYKEVGAKRQ